MSSTPKPIEDYPRKLLYLGSDAEVAARLQSELETISGGEYDLTTISSLNKIKGIELLNFCHAVILDVRSEEGSVSEAIEWVGEHQYPVALFFLCKAYSQLVGYEDKMHLIDDIFLADDLRVDELQVRIPRAITKRRAELELRQDQELLMALLDNVPDSIYFKDRDCRFIRVNAAKARKHKSSPEKMVGKSDFDYFTEERARPAYEEEQRIMRSGDPVLCEVQKLTFDDGSVGWVNTSKLPLNDKLGRVIGTMGISRDVTQQVENEQKLEEARRKLEASE